MKTKESLNILVTGGAGFIGSHLVKRLADDGHYVTVVDNLERGKRENVYNHERVYFIEQDLRKYNKIKHLFAGQNVVVHLASKVGGINVYTSKPHHIMSNNVLIDSNVLMASLKNNVERFVYASSAHVYPDILQDSIMSPRLYESMAYPANCSLSYGWAKLLGEIQVRNAAIEHPFFNASIARFVGIYGPNQDIDLDTGSVIPVLAHRALRYPSVPYKIMTNGEETRSYCYIDDAVDAICLMVDGLKKHKLFGPVNIGKEERVSIKDIAEMVIDVSGKDIELELGDGETKILGQWCACLKAKESLGWEATTPLKDGLKKVYEDIKQRI